MRLRGMLTIAIICSALLVTGDHLTQTESKAAVAAVPAPIVAKPSLSVQATTIEEVEARNLRAGAKQKVTTLADNVFGYTISYPVDWDKTELSSNIVVFQSADAATRIKVEIASALPADGLAGFVDRSLDQDILLSRQLLTIHGLPAERVLVYSDEVESQVTNFYIDADNMVYVISGLGEQKLIESIARSFNAPEAVARR